MIPAPQTSLRTRATLSQALLACGLLVSLCPAGFLYSASAQTGTQTGTQTGDPVSTPQQGAQTAIQAPALQRHPTGIEDAQPDPHEEYLLGGGDEIVVSVAGRPELSGPQIVGPDGRITLPVVGTVMVGEKSRDDAAKSIDEVLGKYYSAVTSTVQVTKYGSNHILLYGAIEKPGLITFDQPPTLLEALTKGGPVVNADKTTQSARKCIVYRGKDQVMNVNISERFDGKRALEDIRLRRGDTVYVPENQETLISVLGEVQRQGPVRLDQNSTLISLLTSAGGITEKAGNNPLILISEPSTGRQQSIRFKELLTLHGGSDVTLHDGDIVYVPRSGLAKTGFIFTQIAPITGMATLATISQR